MHIGKAGPDFAAQAAQCDFSFEISEEAVPPFDGPAPARFVATSLQRKNYPLDIDGYLRPGADRTLFAACDGPRLFGFAALHVGWNGFAHLDDIAVDLAARNQKVGATLLDEAILWSRQHGCAGIFAETQSNNVTACRFYAKCSFVLGGSDRYLYANIPAQRHEIALFWYLLF